MQCLNPWINSELKLNTFYVFINGKYIITLVFTVTFETVLLLQALETYVWFLFNVK